MAASTTPLDNVKFPAERLNVIADHEQAHFWHEPRRLLLLNMIENAGIKGAGPLLDVGCGTGTLVNALLKHGYDARGVDPWAAERNLPASSFRQGTVASLPWPDKTFASICLFDVLEHVDEPGALLELSRVLRPGGILFLSVPAHGFLWSPRDDRAGHLRRYSRASLRAVLVTAGYEVTELFGFQFLLLPALIANRFLARWRNRVTEIDQEDVPSPRVNAILRWINAVEVAAGRIVRPPTGSSLIAVARRPPETRFSCGP